MANPNPFQARQSKRQRGQPGDLGELLAIMWHALTEAQGILDTAAEDAPELKLKSIHAIIQAGSSYAKLLEVGELEARLAALEAHARGTAA